jgi:secreted trypsin-like serine protease
MGLDAAKLRPGHQGPRLATRWVDYRQYPFFTALIFNGSSAPFNRLRCGGSLIDAQTCPSPAAHCVEGHTAAEFEVSIGGTNLNDTSTGEVIGVDRIDSNPQFVSVEQGSDAALLRLSTPSDAPDDHPRRARRRQPGGGQ